MITDIERELGKGLIDGLRTVASCKDGSLGEVALVRISLPLVFEGVAYVVSIATKADHDEENRNAE